MTFVYRKIPRYVRNDFGFWERGGKKARSASIFVAVCVSVRLQCSTCTPSSVAATRFYCNPGHTHILKCRGNACVAPTVSHHYRTLTHTATKMLALRAFSHKHRFLLLAHSPSLVIPIIKIKQEEMTGIFINRFLAAFGMTLPFRREGVEEGGGEAAAFLYLIIIRPVIPNAVRNLSMPLSAPPSLLKGNVIPNAVRNLPKGARPFSRRSRSPQGGAIHRRSGHAIPIEENPTGTRIMQSQLGKTPPAFRLDNLLAGFYPFPANIVFPKWENSAGTQIMQSPCGVLPFSRQYRFPKVGNLRRNSDYAISLRGFTLFPPISFSQSGKTPPALKSHDTPGETHSSPDRVVFLKEECSGELKIGAKNVRKDAKGQRRCEIPRCARNDRTNNNNNVEASGGEAAACLYPSFLKANVIPNAVRNLSKANVIGSPYHKNQTRRNDGTGIVIGNLRGACSKKISC